MLSWPEPTQVNDFPAFATEVPAIPNVFWLSRPSASLGKVGVNTLPTAVMQWPASAKFEPVSTSLKVWFIWMTAANLHQSTEHVESRVTDAVVVTFQRTNHLHADLLTHSSYTHRAITDIILCPRYGAAPWWITELAPYLDCQGVCYWKIWRYPQNRK